jgi:Domain of unknown function (DUF4132)
MKSDDPGNLLDIDLMQDIVGTPAQIALARLEKVIQVVFNDSELNDLEKQTVAFDVLNREPKEVALLVLDRLPNWIFHLIGSPASAWLLYVSKRLLNEGSILDTRTIAEFRIQSVVTKLPKTEENAYARKNLSFDVDRLEQDSPEVTKMVLELLPKTIEKLKQQYVLKDQAGNLQFIFEKLLERKNDLEKIDLELSKIDTPNAQAQFFLTKLRSRARNWIENANENMNYLDLFTSAKNAIKLLQSESLQALLPLIIEDLKPTIGYAQTPEDREALMVSTLFDARLESNVEFSELERTLLLAYLERQTNFLPYYETGARLIEFLASIQQPSGAIVALLRRTLATFDSYVKGYLKPFKTLLESDAYPVSPGEAWADAVLHELKISQYGKLWRKILAHANNPKAKPDAKWEKTALEMITSIPDFESKVLSWLALVGKPRTITLATANDHFDPFNTNILRGLIWALALQPATDVLARAFAAITETSLKKVPGLGPRGAKIANTGVFLLGRMNSLFAVGQLARLKTRVTFKTTLKEIEKALENAAQRQGISKADLEELSIPTCGLERVGASDYQFGETRAELRVVNADVVLTWFDAKNKILKNPPASVKKDFSDDLKDLKTNLKDLEQLLSAQSIRLERFVLAQKTWAYGEWTERYLEHPLVGCVTRRLIWTFSNSGNIQNGMWHEGQMVDARGTPLEISRDATVSLWHPLHSSAERLLDWRNFLEKHNIVQPWKQAHREIYILTDAEIRTNTYSNRFAAHILKQHQFNQLAALRGWNNKLRLMVDDTYPPATLELPQWNLRAEFWVEGAGNDYGVDTTETGTYLYLSTDQVRFYASNANQNHAHASGGGYTQYVPGGDDPSQPIPLEQIPPLVLSEVLRDVDLFVGVASVGNDPTWNDGGPEGRYREYWQSYSFGDLNETAQTRKATLEKLIPRLKIRDVARVEGKFLHVKGSIREYKIHLGSSNILMLPNDQYLCIVPGQTKSSSNVQLPFEGDQMLAVILSKAFLLAEDTKITDQTITRQIKH